MYSDNPALQANLVHSNDFSLAPFAHTWFLDTGATNHATLDGYVLAASETYHGGDTLCVGNGTGLHISGVS